MCLVWPTDLPPDMFRRDIPWTVLLKMPTETQVLFRVKCPFCLSEFNQN
jgi:hypothetical protein